MKHQTDGRSKGPQPRSRASMDADTWRTSRKGGASGLWILAMHAGSVLSPFQCEAETVHAGWESLPESRKALARTRQVHLAVPELPPRGSWGARGASTALDATRTLKEGDDALVAPQPWFSMHGNACYVKLDEVEQAATFLSPSLSTESRSRCGRCWKLNFLQFAGSAFGRALNGRLGASSVPLAPSTERE